MNNRSIVTSSVGFLFVGLLIWLHGLHLAGWSQSASGGVAAESLPMLLVLGVLAILAYLHDDVLDSVILFAFAIRILSPSVATMAGEGAYGWAVLILGIFFLCVYRASGTGGGLRAWFALVFGLALVVDAIKHWTGDGHVLALIEGYLHLIAGLLALAKAYCALACNKEPAAG